MLTLIVMCLQCILVIFVVRKLILRLLFVEKSLDWHLEIMVSIFMSLATTPMVWQLSFMRRRIIAELVSFRCFQCFDTVGWAAGRASGL